MPKLTEDQKMLIKEQIKEGGIGLVVFFLTIAVIAAGFGLLEIAMMPGGL